MRSARLTVLFILLGACLPGTASAGFSANLLFNPVSDEFEVSQARTFPVRLHLYAQVSRAANGSFVVAWDAVGVGVYARRFNPDGTPAGDMFFVDAVTTTTSVDVATTATGNFIIGWTESSGGHYRGFARTYNSTGTARTNAFQVTSGASTEDQVLGGLACDSAGNFVVVWSAEGGHDNSESGVYARRYDINGNQTGTPGSTSQLNDTTSGWQYGRDIAMNESGDGVVLYTSDSDPGDRYFSSTVYARRIARGASNVTGNEILVTSSLAYAEGSPQKVDIADDGSFAAVVTTDQDIFGRLFDPAGVAKTGLFGINESSPDSQVGPDVAINDAGTTAVAVWNDLGPSDGSESSVQARLFGEEGTKSAQILVNQTTFSHQDNPTVAMDPAGGIVVAWDNEDPAVRASDDDTDINGRLLGIGGSPRPPPPFVLPRLYFRRSSQVGGRGNFPLDLDCPGQQRSCSFDSSGTYDGLGGRLSASQSIGRHTFTVRPGRSRVASFRLNAAARRAVRRGSLRVRLKVIGRAGGHSRTFRRTVTLRALKTKVKASAGGLVPIRVHFDPGGTFGKATIELLRGRSILASAPVDVVHGDSVIKRLRLPAAERARLRSAGRLRLTVRVLAPALELPFLTQRVPGGLPPREISRQAITVLP